MLSIIGISGKIHTGKTELATALKKLMGCHSKVFSFTTELKKEAAEFYDFPLAWTDTQEGVERFVDIRKVPKNWWPSKRDTAWIHLSMASSIPHATVHSLLQVYGRKKRQENPNYWIEKLLEAVAEWRVSMRTLDGWDIPVCVVIDDIKYPNEKAICHLTICLTPPPCWSPDPNADYASEIALDADSFDVSVVLDSARGAESLAKEILNSEACKKQITEECLFGYLLFEQGELL